MPGASGPLGTMGDVIIPSKGAVNRVSVLDEILDGVRADLMAPVSGRCRFDAPERGRVPGRITG